MQIIRTDKHTFINAADIRRAKINHEYDERCIQELFGPRPFSIDYVYEGGTIILYTVHQKIEISIDLHCKTEEEAQVIFDEFLEAMMNGKSFSFCDSKDILLCTKCKHNTDGTPPNSTIHVCYACNNHDHFIKKENG